ncbi:hypothetical protein GCM10008024_07280 [Allgaiera indica]|uniref:Uncharacterized conserved protein YjiS, DUF1127 family n=1 Tax=Allgaiera indica TaxID=765699 RepID=A0AAN4UPC7_9RHOB|nr:DUF1127 domain-containing protein [Allgaiera indica]GHD99531.1 hypothetical protein GCM10008024_07280 [Allgaiera indica]SDW23693.1 Uncharacterized conserved protein YjiS, DUF1127 family [Allgaiera indica]
MTTSVHTSGVAVRSAHATHPLARLAGLARRALALRRERNILARLDDRALADIGLTRTQAQAEAARPVWDVPAYWRR